MIARNDLQPFFEDIDAHLEQYIAELCDFLRIPSISVRQDRPEHMEKAAHWVLEQLRTLGFTCSLYPTAGWPIVYAKLEVAADAPTLLIYGHYDVQPEDPLDEWLSPPFTPTLRNGAIYARGVNDDKGQFFTYIKALETYKRVTGSLPLNFIFVVEGEEEIGSKSLLSLIREHGELLKSDIFLVSDSSMLSKDTPAITCGFRGILSMEVALQTMSKDVHSGIFGGVALNAAETLGRLLTQMKDADGRIMIPGFYDDVQPLTDAECQSINSLPLDEDELAGSLGMPCLYGEPAFSAIERKGTRPTLDINGIWGGFTGEGSKTVIPARAYAKISSRLVSNQHPETVFECCKKFILEHIPRGTTVDIRYLFGALPVTVDTADPNVRLAAEAIRDGFGCGPVYLRSGGTVHIISEIKDRLNIPSILILGWGRPENGSHSPNECFYTDDFRKAVYSLCSLLERLTRS